jgi:hypothetical protein
MRFGYLLGIVAALLLTGCAQGGGRSAVVATGQPSKIAFACPAPGTHTATTTASNTTNLTWDGADSSDPAVCLATNTAGRTQRFLYGYFTLPFSAETEARQAFSGAFAGSPTETCFNVTTTTIASVAGNNVNTYRRCLRQLGSSTEPGSKLVVFEMTDRGMANNTFRGLWTLYYDPAQHLFVRADLDVESGSGSGGWRRVVVASS